MVGALREWVGGLVVILCQASAVLPNNILYSNIFLKDARQISEKRGADLRRILHVRDLSCVEAE